MCAVRTYFLYVSCKCDTVINDNVANCLEPGPSGQRHDSRLVLNRKKTYEGRKNTCKNIVVIQALYFVIRFISIISVVNNGFQAF